MIYKRKDEVVEADKVEEEQEEDKDKKKKEDKKRGKSQGRGKSRGRLAVNEDGEEEIPKFTSSYQEY